MDPHSQEQTRKKLIDPKIQSAGWIIVLHEENKSLAASDRCAIAEYPTSNGPAAYALGR